MKFFHNPPINILLIIFVGVIIGVFLTEANPELKTIGFASSPAAKSLQARNLTTEPNAIALHSCELHGGYCDLSGCLLSEEEIELTQATQFCSQGALCCARVYRIGTQTRTESINGINVTMRIVNENGFLQYTDLSVQGAVKRIPNSLLNQQLYFGGCNVQVYSNTWTGDPPLFVNSLIRVWNCSPVGSPFCGNSVMEAGEQCDVSQLLTDQCRLLGFDSGTVSCNFSNCTLNTSACTAICGNGLISPTEQCDDGGLCSNNSTQCISDAFCTYYGATGPCTKQNGDGCNTQCQLEYCGDGIINNAVNGIISETCDDEDQQNGDGCNSTCQLEFCGDGAINNNNTEQCDDGNNINGDGCTSACDIESAICGNGIIESGEQCDDNNTNNWDGCNSTCQTETPVCGNNHLEQGEQCDDGNIISGDGCSSACQTEQTTSLCGNGAINAGEQCDGTNLGVYGNGVNKCTQYNDPLYDGGNLTCFPAGDIYQRDCTINYLACTGPPHADFKTFKKTSSSPLQFNEVNLLTEELELGEKYRFDATYSIGETVAGWFLGNGEVNIGVVSDFGYSTFGSYNIILAIDNDEETRNVSIAQGIHPLSATPIPPELFTPRVTKVSGGKAWSRSSQVTLGVLDVTNPNNLPALESILTGLVNSSDDFDVSNGKFYVGKQDRLKIYTANPSNPVLQSEVTAQQLGVGSIVNIEVVGNWVYVATAVPNKIIAVDATSATNPIIRNSVTSSLAIIHLDAASNDALAFGTSYAGSPVVIIDIRDKANPSLVGQTSNTLIFNRDNGAANENKVGGIIFEATGNRKVYYFDIIVPSNAQNPITIGQVNIRDIPGYQDTINYQVIGIEKERFYLKREVLSDIKLIKFSVLDPNDFYVYEVADVSSTNLWLVDNDGSVGPQEPFILGSKNTFGFNSYSK